MKRIGVILIAGLSLYACKTSDKKTIAGGISKEEGAKALKDSANYTSIQWLDSTFKDLGKIKEGEQVDVAFRFKNSGTKNLVITDVTASCGCTVPEKPGKAFPPGQEGTIKAKFNSSGKSGVANKTIYVTANTIPSNLHELNFQAEIIK